ncbi:MAG: NADH-quinone oxidoreductase subunit J, partial [Gemmatimonadaceae bacterium]
MPVLFAFAAIIAVIATVLAITRRNAVHALLYLVASLLAVAVAIYALGAPYLAALEVIIYAGAIIVLFVFVNMMLNLGEAAKRQEQAWQPGRGWIGPGVL